MTSGGAAGSSDLLTPDLCVIGAGSGGLTVAAGAASFGTSVVLIENNRMGGDCLNFGCVPSKALIAAAAKAHAFRSGEAFGVSFAEPTVDFAKVRAHVRGVIDGIAPHDSEERFTGLGVTVIRDHARFVDPHTVEAGGIRIKARRFVLATGSRPAMPPTPGLDEVGALTNETIFDLAECPRHLAILGGGAIGVELAQAFRRLGAAVTIIEAQTVLAREDPECAQPVLDALRREGVRLIEGAKVSRVERSGEGVTLHLDGETIEATHLLVATGRKPNIEDLGLDAAGIETGPRGVTVDRALRTTNRRVYAIGDVAGGHFTHIAGYHGAMILRPLLFRLPIRIRPEILPRVTYTDPEIASVGLIEREAQESGQLAKTLRWSLAENDRARTERRTEGGIKLVLGARGRILGATITAPHAGELIQVWALAIAKDLKIGAMTAYVPPYPTMGEIGKRAAVTYFEGAARNRAVRSLVRGLRLFG